MKYAIVLFLFFISVLNAYPIINHEEIKKWCCTLSSLNKQESNLLKDYLQKLEEYSQHCLKNPNWAHSAQAQELVQEIDNDVKRIEKDQNLAKIFYAFTALIKVEESQNSSNNNDKEYYELLAVVVTGCLQCLNAR